jgi:hypothetical protein
MKIFFIVILVFSSLFSMDVSEINNMIMREENAKCIFDYDRLMNLTDIHKIYEPTIEIVQNIRIEEPENPRKCCSCDKSKAVVIGALITAGSAISVSCIAGIITIIVTIIKNT